MKNTQVITLPATKTNPAIKVVKICREGVMELLDSPAAEKFLGKLNGWAIAHDARSYYRTEDADASFVWDVLAEMLDTSGRSGESAVDLEDAKVVAERFESIMAEGVGFEATFDRWVTKLSTTKPFWNAPACPEYIPTENDDEAEFPVDHVKELAEVLRPICRSFRLAKASASDF